MLNLSDKELDRLSREAAQEHDPGDIMGPRSWDKLQVHLDRDLGRVSPNRLGSIRRLPFYFTPAVLLIFGVSYYLVRQGKAKKEGPPGSPPLTAVQSAVPAEKNDPSTKTLDHNKNSTPAPGQTPITVPYPASPGQAGSASPASSAAGSPSSATPSSRDGVSPSAAGSTAAAPSSPVGSGSSVASSSPHPAASTAAPGSPSPSATSSSTGSATVRSANAGSRVADANLTARNARHTGPISHGTNAARTTSATKGKDLSGTGKDRLTKNNPPRSTHNNAADGNNSVVSAKGATDLSAGNLTAHDAIKAHRDAVANDQARSPEFTLIQHPGSMRKTPRVDDSALRAFTLKMTPAGPIKRRGVLMENKRLQIGLSIAPDFTSVNSLAGDHPGSSIGLTADYQFANRWYIGTGFLVTRKNYAARSQDYHAPYSFIQNNNLHNIDFEKGTFYMMEVPLNLRYDFSVTGSTLFFASVGVSSYLFTKENCNYYYNNFGREFVRGFDYANKNNYLFSSVNLSMGVETGISNSISLLVAPYMQLPTHNIGFGQIQMNSVGVNFVLKYTPVLSRKRR